MPLPRKLPYNMEYDSTMDTAIAAYQAKFTESTNQWKALLWEQRVLLERLEQVQTSLDRMYI